MEKTKKQKTKQKKTSMILGIINFVFITLFLIIGSVPLIAGQISDGTWTRSYITQYVIILIVLIVNILMLFFSIKSVHKKWACITMIVASIFLAVVPCLLYLIGGIVGLSKIKKLKKINIEASAKVSDNTDVDCNENRILAAYLKNGDTEYENLTRNAELSYSEVLLDKNNNYPLVAHLQNKDIYFKQEAVIQTNSGLFCMVTPLQDGVNHELVGMFAVIDNNGQEDLAIVDESFPEYNEIGNIYGSLLNGNFDGNAIQNTDNFNPNDETLTATIKTPSKTGSIIMCCIISLYYLALTILGFLGMFLGKDILWSGNTPELTKALNFVTGLIILALIPSIGFYISIKGPFKRNKVSLITIISVSLALMIIIDILYFVFKTPYDEVLRNSQSISKFANDSVILTVSLFIGQIGLILLYGLSLVHINTSRFVKLKAGKCASNSFGQVILHLAKEICYGFINLMKSVLKFKEKHTTAFLVIGTIALTLCLFVSVDVLIALVIALVIFGIVLIFSRFISGLYSPASTPSFNLTDDSGSNRTLTYHSYDYYQSQDVYKDDIGQYWRTQDGGKTFFRQ